jgi:hypothetical protein
MNSTHKKRLLVFFIALILVDFVLPFYFLFGEEAAGGSIVGLGIVPKLVGHLH